MRSMSIVPAARVSINDVWEAGAPPDQLAYIRIDNDSYRILPRQKTPPELRRNAFQPFWRVSRYPA